MSYTSPEELIAEVDMLIASTSNSGVPRLLRQLKPHVLQLQSFTLGVLVALNFTVQHVFIWCLITLMLQVWRGAVVIRYHFG